MPERAAQPLSPCPSCGRTPETAQSRTGPKLDDPNHPDIRDALTRKCDQCHAPAGQLCVKRDGFHADLTGRLIHLGRKHEP